MPVEQTPFRDRNIRRLRRIGIEAGPIRAFYGFAEGSKRVYQIADWKWRDDPATYPKDVPIAEEEAVVWLDSNAATVKALKKIGVLGIYSSTGPMGETLSRNKFQVYFMLSNVEEAVETWSTLATARHHTGVSTKFMNSHLDGIKHISAGKGAMLKWNGLEIEHLVKISSVQGCWESRPPEPSEEQPLEEVKETMAEPKKFKKARPEFEERNKNIRRLVAVGFSREHICEIYGFKDVKRIKEIRTEYGIAPPDDPAISVEEAAWLLDSNSKTIMALLNKGALVWHAKSGLVIPTCGITKEPFREFLYKSYVEQIRGVWTSVTKAAEAASVSMGYIGMFIDDIEHCVAYEGRPYKIYGKGNLRFLVNVDSVKELVSKKHPIEVHEPQQGVLPLEIKSAGGNHIVEYVLKVAELIDYKGHSLVGKKHLQTILLNNGGLTSLMECNIPPKEVADFINSMEQDPPHNVFPDEQVRAVLSNRHIHGLIATDARLQDEDKFYKEWVFDGKIGFWSRKK